jgi:hypothetical protein
VVSRLSRERTCGATTMSPRDRRSARTAG